MKAFIIILALAVIGAHVWFSRQLHQDENETILNKALAAKLQERFGSDVETNYNYIDGILEGTVADQRTYDEVESFVKENRLAGRVINDLKISGSGGTPVSSPIASDIDPASLLSTWDGETLILKGSVPNEQIKSDLALGVSSLGAKHVVNDLKVVSTVTKPAWSATMPAFLSRFFIDTKSGELEVVGDKLRLKRDVAGEHDKSQLVAKTKNWGLVLEDQIRIVKVDVPKKEKPIAPSAPVVKRKKGNVLAVCKGDAITFTGLVGNSSTKFLLEKDAAATGLKIINNLKVSESVENLAWSDSVKSFMSDFFNGTSAGEVEISPDEVRIKGEVPHFRRKFALVEKSKSLLPNVILNDQLSFSKPAPDFDYGIKRDGQNLKLSGWLPSLNLKNKITDAAKAKYSDFQIVDELYVSPHVNMPGWGGGIPKFTSKLPGWDGWNQFRLSSKGLDVVGPAKLKLGEIANNCFDASFPKVERSQFKARELKVVEPPKPSPSKPARILAVLENSKLKITGQVPTKELKSSIGKEVSKLLPGVKVQNSLKVNKAEIIKPVWDRDVASFIGEFLATNPASAELEIDDKGLRLKQQLSSESVKSKWVSKARVMPGNFIDQLSVVVPLPASEPVEVTPLIPKPIDTAKPKSEVVGALEELSKFYIHFDTNSHWVKQPGIDRIQAAVDASKKMGGSPVFVIQGFADSRGDKLSNQSLSERRAGSVVYLLNSKGVRSDSIKVGAVGESQSYGRGNQWWDRRVEITLKK